MLLRSASSPILRSWVKGPSSEALILRNISASAVLSSSPCSPLPNPFQKISRTSSANNLKDLSKAKTKILSNDFAHVVSDIEENHVKVFNLGLSISTMSLESMVEGADEECDVLVDGGGRGSNGGRLRGGNGGGRGGDDECSGSDHGFESIDQYYQEMIMANPTNALLLQNYAKFLKEVKGDYEKAEEYCARAILANANDGEVFSLYGELMWDIHKNAERAKCYFDRALQAAPDDCYTMASYARCLWDAEEEDNEDQQKLQETNISASSADIFQGLTAPSGPHIAAS